MLSVKKCASDDAGGDNCLWSSLHTFFTVCLSLATTPREGAPHCDNRSWSSFMYFSFYQTGLLIICWGIKKEFVIICPNSITHNVPAVVQKNCSSILRSGFREWETFAGENAALNKVLVLICLSLQETLRALCCKVSASCLPLFLTHSFSSPPSPPSFFPTTCSASDRIYSPSWGGGGGGGVQHLVPTAPPYPQTHVVLPALLPCCTSDSCESQCCSLIQGKCQTQETVSKYLNTQRFFSWNSFFYQQRSSSKLLLCDTNADTGIVQLKANAF